VLQRKQVFFLLGVVGVGLIFGMIYGSLLRQARSENQDIGVEAQLDNAQRVVNTLGNSSSSDSLLMGLNILAERLDELSPLAVVVSNYEQLAPYEEGYGLDDNIRKDLLTNLVPRFIWNNKPLASDPHLYGALYFEYGENSFTVTPMGDLLRNYGVTGVFIGMLILGILLRMIYRSLVEDQEPSLIRGTLYFMLIMSVNYEGFYGMIFPYLVKVGVTTLVGLVIVSVLSKRLKGTSYPR